MTQHIHAIFENGVLKPLEPLHLPDQTRVKVSVEKAEGSESAEKVKAQQVQGTLTADALGYPVGYFESTAGSFADEPLERPADLPMDSRESW